MAKKPLTVETLTHDEATRLNAPTAELEAFMPADMKTPIRVAYERRNPDLDPQLVWRGKDMTDWSDLVVEAPPLYIQEKIHPKALIEDLKRASARRREPEAAPDLFADFNGIEPDQRTEFYQHDQHWSNRMILGDGLKVMASLAEREGLKGQVQCIYIDPPYGIKFNSNFQWSTTSRDVKDGKVDHFSREPEQVKAFRDTWVDGIHSYLTYLRDRLTVARDLLTESGSVFVQIGDENVHRVRALMDEVFGPDNCVAEIVVRKTSSATSRFVAGVADFILFYAKNADQLKYRQLYSLKGESMVGTSGYNRVQAEDGQRSPIGSAAIPAGARVYSQDNLTSQRPPGDFPVDVSGRGYRPRTGYWKTGELGMGRLLKALRVEAQQNTLRYVRFIDDFGVIPISNIWDDISGAVQSRSDPKIYVVQSSADIAARCVLMTTDPGDLVLDPTCGSGTTAYVAEQWGRRWITIDTSRVALALARARIMGARYPWYLLADSREGQVKEGEVTRSVPADTPTYGRLRQGFVYKRVPHITLKSIANNAEIDTIWESHQAKLEPLREAINATLGTDWQEWQIPRELTAQQSAASETHAAWWQARIARQKEIDASIAAKAETEYLYDQPYDDKSRVRVAGPFTVESLSPHRVPAMDVDDSLFDEWRPPRGGAKPAPPPRASTSPRWCWKISGALACSRRTRPTGWSSPR
jgi:adenine-specific DNA-methyltransferase